MMKQKVINRKYKGVIQILVILFCVLFLLQSTIAAHATEYFVNEEELIVEPYDPIINEKMSGYKSPGSPPTIVDIFWYIIDYYSNLTSPVHKINENTGEKSFDLLVKGGLIKKYIICQFKDSSRVVLLLKDKNLEEHYNKKIYETCLEYVYRYSKPYLIKKSKDSFIIYDSDNITEMIAPDDYIYYWVSVNDYKMIMARKEREKNRTKKTN